MDQPSLKVSQVGYLILSNLVSNGKSIAPKEQVDPQNVVETDRPLGISTSKLIFAQIFILNYLLCSKGTQKFDETFLVEIICKNRVPQNKIRIVPTYMNFLYGLYSWTFLLTSLVDFQSFPLQTLMLSSNYFFCADFCKITWQYKRRKRRIFTVFC